MKEFLFEDKPENLVDLLGFPRTKKCFVVVNAELGTTYPSGVGLSSYPKLPSPSNASKVRDQLVKEAVAKGVRKAL